MKSKQFKKKMFTGLLILLIVSFFQCHPALSCTALDVDAWGAYPVSSPGESMIRGDGRFLFVLDSDVVSVVDVSKNEVVWQLPAGRMNRGMALAESGLSGADGSKVRSAILYTGSVMDGEIVVHDVSGDSAVDFSPALTASGAGSSGSSYGTSAVYRFDGQPAALCFNDDGTRLFMADRVSGHIVVLSPGAGSFTDLSSVTTLTKVDEIEHDKGGKHPSRIVVKGGHLYVLFSTSRQIAHYDLAASAWVATVNGLGGAQFDICLDESGRDRLYVAREGGIDVLDGSSLTLLKSITYQGKLEMPKGLAVMGDTLFVSESEQGAVLQVDITPGTMGLTEERCAAGRGPQWITLLPPGVLKTDENGSDTGADGTGRLYISGTDRISWFPVGGEMTVTYQNSLGEVVTAAERFVDPGETVEFNISGGSGTYSADCTGDGIAEVIAASSQEGDDGADTGAVVRVTAPSSTGEHTLTITDNHTGVRVVISLRVGTKFSITTETTPVDGGSISLSPDLDAYNADTTVVATAKANPCYRFVGWSGSDCKKADGETGDDVAPNPQCTLMMDQDKYLTARFEKSGYALQVGLSSRDRGSVTVSWDQSQTILPTEIDFLDSGELVCGTSVTLTANPAPGYSLTAWQGLTEDIISGKTGEMDGESGETAGADDGLSNSVNRNPVTFPLFKDVSVTAVFESNLRISPSSIRLEPRERFKALITGGVPPYRIKEFDTGIDRAVIDGMSGNTDHADLIVIQTSDDFAGTSRIEIVDAAGTSFAAEVMIFEPLIVDHTRFFLPLGETKTLTVSGGILPCTMVQTSESNSGDNGMLSVEKDGDDPARFTLTGQALGPVMLAVKDDSLQTVTLQVTVTSPTVTISPDIMNLVTGESREITVTGGTGNYTWQSEAGGILSRVSEKIFLYTAPDTLSHCLNPDPDSDTVCDVITFTDSSGKQGHAEVYLDTTPFAVTPSMARCYPGQEKVFSLVGGTPPFTLTADRGEHKWNDADCEIKDEPDMKCRFIYEPTRQMGEYTITVRDADGDTASAVVEVMGSILLNPAMVYVDPGETSTFHVSGGAPPYRFQIESGLISDIQDDRAILTVPDRTGTYTVTVLDALENRAASLLTVGDAPRISPRYIHAAPSETISFEIKGGYPPFTVVCDTGTTPFETGVHQYEHEVSDTLGIYYITVTDTKGRSSELQVDVSGSDVSITPKILSLQPGEDMQITLNGGSPPYTLSADIGSLVPDGAGIWLYNAPDRAVHAGGSGTASLEGRYSLKAVDNKGNTASAMIIMLPAEDLPVSECPTTVTLDLTIQVNCAAYGGTAYGFHLVPQKMTQPDYIWRLDPDSLLPCDAGAATEQISENLTISIPCADIQGAHYGFDLELTDGKLLLFELNLDTLTPVH